MLHFIKVNLEKPCTEEGLNKNSIRLKTSGGEF